MSRHAAIVFPEGSAELELFGRSVAMGLEDRGHSCEVRGDEQDALSISIGTRTVRLAWDPWKGTLLDRDWPLAVSPAVHPRLVPPPAPIGSRICFRAEPPSRRMRMMSRTVTELRRRGHTIGVSAIGPVDEEWPDEAFPSLAAEDLLRLLASSRAYVDAGSEDDSQQLLTLLAIAGGFAVITSAPRKHEGAANLVAVPEWSADALSDAILGVRAVRVPPGSDAIESVVQSVERALLLD